MMPGQYPIKHSSSSDHSMILMYCALSVIFETPIDPFFTRVDKAYFPQVDDELLYFSGHRISQNISDVQLFKIYSS